MNLELINCCFSFDLQLDLLLSSSGGTGSAPHPQETEAGSQPWCKMKFEFRMNKLSATLYAGDSKLVSNFWNIGLYLGFR